MYFLGLEGSRSHQKPTESYLTFLKNSCKKLPRIFLNAQVQESLQVFKKLLVVKSVKYGVKHPGLKRFKVSKNTFFVVNLLHYLRYLILYYFQLHEILPTAPLADAPHEIRMRPRAAVPVRIVPAQVQAQVRSHCSHEGEAQPPEGIKQGEHVEQERPAWVSNRKYYRLTFFAFHFKSAFLTIYYI